MSQRNSSTEAGDINRKTSEKQGHEGSGTGADFGQKIGRSENLEGGNMENKNKDNMNNPNSGMDRERESSRQPGGDTGFGSSKGRSSGSSDIDKSSDLDKNSDLNENRGNRTGSGNVDEQ